MNCRAIIFDLDGTLINTLEDLTAAVNTALPHFSLPGHSPEPCKMMIGNGPQRFAERALPAERQHLAAALGIVDSMGLASRDFLFIGDSAVDIETARAAGMPAVGAAWGFRPRSEPRAAGADMIIDTQHEILDLVA